MLFTLGEIEKTALQIDVDIAGVITFKVDGSVGKTKSRLRILDPITEAEVLVLNTGLGEQKNQLAGIGIKRVTAQKKMAMIGGITKTVMLEPKYVLETIE